MEGQSAGAWMFNSVQLWGPLGEPERHMPADAMSSIGFHPVSSRPKSWRAAGAKRRSSFTHSKRCTSTRCFSSLNRLNEFASPRPRVEVAERSVH